MYVFKLIFNALLTKLSTNVKNRMKKDNKKKKQQNCNKEKITQNWRINTQEYFVFYVAHMFCCKSVCLYGC